MLSLHGGMSGTAGNRGTATARLRSQVSGVRRRRGQKDAALFPGRREVTSAKATVPNTC